MDATATWCSSHQVALVPIVPISRVALRRLDNAQHDLRSLALARREAAPTWLEQLAQDATQLAGLLPVARGTIPTERSAMRSAPDTSILLKKLLDQVVIRVLDAAIEYDDATLLAKHLSAPGAESLEIFRLPRNAAKLHASVLGQVRKVRQRTWLLGAAATIIAPTASSKEFLGRGGALRETLRTWLWARTDAWNLVKLVPVVREVTAAGLMVPWQAAQSWRSPRTAAEWFYRQSDFR